MNDALEPQNDPESLQFDRAEFDESAEQTTPAGPSSVPCSRCASPITDAYFQINGVVACKTCHDKAVEERTAGSGVGRFVRASVFGFIAAVIGFFIYWGIAALTDMEFSIVAMLVGFLVGTGVKIGARSRGGWLYQLMAVALTYLSIVASYVPFVIAGIAEEMPEEGIAVTETTTDSAPANAALFEDDEPAIEEPAETSTSAERSISAEPAPVDPAEAEELWLDELLGGLLPEEDEELGLGAVVVVLIVFFVLILALPFMAGLESILSLIIIGVGLWVAWAINKKEAFETEGPFQVGGGPSGTATAAPA